MTEARVLPSTINSEMKTLYEQFQWVKDMIQEGPQSLQPDYVEEETSLVTLAELACRAVAKYIEIIPEAARNIPGRSADLFYDSLDPNIDPVITAPNVADGYYWERCATARWPDEYVHPTWRARRSWKRLFLERYLSEYLENLEPGYIDYEEVASICSTMAPFVRRLDIRGLRSVHFSKEEAVSDIEQESSIGSSTTPISQISSTPSSVQEEISDSEVIEGPVIRDRLDMRVPLNNLPKLRELKLHLGMTNYGPPECCPGTGCHEPALINDDDADRLGNALASLGPSLQKLTIRRSFFENHHILNKVLQPLMSNKFLHTVDLSHCFINDEGASVIAEQLISKMGLPPVTCLILKNNSITASGAMHIANALVAQPQPVLQKIDLTFNPLKNLGGRYFATALTANTELRELILVACELQDGAAVGIADSLLFNTDIHAIDLRNNTLLTDKTATAVFEALRMNRRIRRIDLRGCGFHPDTLADLKEVLGENRERVRGVEPVTKRKTFEERLEERRKRREEFRADERPSTPSSGIHSWTLSESYMGDLTPDWNSDAGHELSSEIPAERSSEGGLSQELSEELNLTDFQEVKETVIQRRVEKKSVRPKSFA